MDDKKTQQSSTRSHSLSTSIQHHPYISLIIPSLIFISISAIHFFTIDKTFQTTLQAIAYILGLIIVIILFLIAHNQRKADSSKIDLIFLCGIFLAILLGFAYFSKIIGDISAIIIGIASIAVQIALLLYAKTGKSKESDTQENLSNPSPEFIQENSSTSIQNNSPISIHNNNNSPISIQNNINTTQNVTNIIDKQSERERATAKACEMLSSKNPTSRISGVKLLANLADSWLDDSDPTCKQDEEKCQDIIDILCAYIRSPFPLAEKIEEYEARKELEKLQKTESENLSEEESSRRQVLLKRFKDSDEYKNPHDIATDYAKFHEEQDVRRTIFAEMSKRSSTIKDNNAKIFTPLPGAWSKFDFNFSRAPIFYPLNNLKIEKARFAGATFYTDAKFDEVTFIGDADFKRATFTSNASFIWATFATTESYLGANFREATFNGAVNFTHTIFIGSVLFSNATFNGTADFRWPEFRNDEPRFVIQDERAKFSARLNPKDNNFLATPGGKTIDLGTATLLGKPFEIPLGTILFDPDSPKDQRGNYAVQSEPAKPIEESDSQGETPSK